MTHPKHSRHRAVVAVLLLGSLLLLAACGRCSSERDERDPGGPLLLVAPASVLRHIGPLMDGFTKTRPGERVTLIAAEGEEALGYAMRGDVFLVVGQPQAQRLAQRLKQSGELPLYLNDRVELVARSSFSLTVDRPSHLLQPAVKSIALVDAARPAGQAARATLADWKLEERIGFKFIPAKDSEAALRLVDAGTVDMAFVRRSQHQDFPTLRVLLGRSQRPGGVIPLYLLWPAESARQARAEALREFLASEGVVGKLAERGWLRPGEQAAPQPMRPGLPPRIHPSRLPQADGDTADGDTTEENDTTAQNGDSEPTTDAPTDPTP